MDLVILETGKPPGTLAETHGSYADMFEHMLAGRLDGLRPRIVDVTASPMPVPDEADGYLITGSPAGAYEQHPWIAPLESFIRNCVTTRTPLVGICFGHQVMAQALGGRVEKSAKGWGMGVHCYDLVPDAGRDETRVACIVSHQDQVVALPAEATRLGGSPFCPNGIISYGTAALSFQMHPEFEHDYAQALQDLHEAEMPVDMAALARASYDLPTDRGVIADWIAQILRGGDGQKGHTV